MSLELISKNLVIKKPSKEHLNSLVQELNNWEISKWLVRVPYPYKYEDAIKWLRLTENNELSFNIFIKNILIGGISLDTEENSLHLELGYWISEKYWGNGYAQESCQSLIKYAFNNTSMSIIHASHMADNNKSKKILINLGFKEIGKGKKFSISRGEEVEDIDYELLKS